MLVMIGAFSSTMFEFGRKVDGDASRVLIEDNSNLLNASQEKEVLELFNKVYEKSGMPVTLYTTDFSWKDNYYSIEAYSEELYYKMGTDEDAMIILFTSEDVNGFWNWEYDMYCGDDTIKCLSDNAFNKLLSNFQKSMAREDLAYALEYSWSSVIDDIGAKFKIYVETVPIVAFLLLFYGTFYFVILSNVFKNNRIYKYFKEHPEELSMTPMVLHSECPSCGASNTFQTETCSYCGGNLKIDKAYK
jgi:hypothetical protein